MKILMLSWEYPPHNVGGLGRHVEDLSLSLARRGQRIHVITLGPQEEEEKRPGVWIHRVASYPLQYHDFLTWVLQLNIRFLEKAIEIVDRYGPFHIIHGHDWLVAFAARALKHAYRVPLVATIHAIEAGRNQGLCSDLQRFINSVEWWLTYEAWK